MIILGTNSIKDAGGFNVDNSLRFNNGTADRLQRTQDTADSRKKFTLSYWMKKTKSVRTMVLHSFNGGEYIYHDYENDRLSMYSQTGGTLNFNVTPTRLFRDPSAFFHIVIAVDTTQSTASNRIKIYVNGVQETVFTNSTYPSLNLDCELGTTSHLLNFGPYNVNGNTFDGYLAEVVLIDNQALEPDQFGEFDEDSGIWKPIKVSGLTFGTNGSYLEFKESGTGTNASGMGADTSGNTNHFAVNNLTAIDQSTDTCTNNFATMNPLDNFWQGFAFSDGNTTVTTTNASQSYSTSSIMVSSGKWYVECKPVSGGSEPEIGIFSKLTGANAGNNSQLSYNANGYAYRASNPGSVWYNGSAVSTSFSQYANGDIVGIALDLDNNKLYFSKNGTFGNSGNPTSGSTGTGAISIVAPTSTTLGAYAFAMNETFNDQNKVFSWNFGNAPFAISSGNTDGNGRGNFEYAVPDGYLSLNTKNLSEELS